MGRVCVTQNFTEIKQSSAELWPFCTCFRRQTDRRTDRHMDSIIAWSCRERDLTLNGHIKTAEQRTTVQQYCDWYTGR